METEIAKTTETSVSSLGSQILENGKQVADSISGFSRSEIDEINKRFWEEPVDYSRSSFSKVDLDRLNVHLNTTCWGDHNTLEHLKH